MPDALPEFITVDLSNLTIQAPIHISDLKLPEGVSAVVKAGEDATVASASIPGAEEVDTLAADAENTEATPVVEGKSAE